MSEVKITTSGELHLDGDIVAGNRMAAGHTVEDQSRAHTISTKWSIMAAIGIDCAKLRGAPRQVGDRRSPQRQVGPAYRKDAQGALTQRGVLMSSIDALGAVHF